jgi:hypothetical protein
MNAIRPRASDEPPARARGRHAAAPTLTVSRGVGVLASVVLLAGAAIAVVKTAGASAAGTTVSAVSSEPAMPSQSVEPVVASSAAVAPSRSASVIPQVTPSVTVTASARPSTVKVNGSVPIMYSEFDEIYGGTSCQGGGDGYVGFGDDLRMMSLQVGSPVTVTNGKGKKAGSGKLERGVLSADGNDCTMPFEVLVKLAGGAPYRVRIGVRCNDCDYPSVITKTFTAKELEGPVEVPPDDWR